MTKKYYTYALSTLIGTMANVACPYGVSACGGLHASSVTIGDYELKVWWIWRLLDWDIIALAFNGGIKSHKLW